MNTQANKKGDQPATPTREERLAQQLRANLHRRKAQSRGRKAQSRDSKSAEDTSQNEPEKGDA